MNDSTTFDAYGLYYEAFYADKEYENEADYVNRLIHRYYGSANEILELGCGTGSHAAFLSRYGSTVLGLDKSEVMIAQAKRKGIPNFTPLVSDITRFALPQKFDAAVSFFHVISYLTTNEELVACFRTVHRHLQKDGLFVFDAWYSPAVYAQRLETRTKQRALNGCRVTRLAEPHLRVNDNVVDVEYRITVEDPGSGAAAPIRERHSMRHFGLPEIELLGRLTGFELVSAEEPVTGKAPATDTWGVCFVLKKICETHPR